MCNKPLALPIGEASSLWKSLATYQTQPHLGRYSISFLVRLIFKMLMVLRVPPMARTSNFALVLVLCLAGVLSCPRLHAAESSSKHPAASSKRHVVHHTSRRVASKSSNAKKRPTAKVSTRKSKTTASRAGSRKARRTVAGKSVHARPSRHRVVRRVPAHRSAKSIRASRLHRAAIQRKRHLGAHLERASFETTHESRAELSKNELDSLPSVTSTTPHPALEPTIATPAAAPGHNSAAEFRHIPGIDQSAIQAHVNPIPAFAAGGITAVAPLRGSFESLARQNEKTDDDGLERILDNADLEDRIARGYLVKVPVSDALTINQNLPDMRRYCRPWTATFLKDLSRAHEKRFDRPFEVSSAVRTVAYQKQLMRHNGNAAAAVGEVVSPHVTGATIDIAKHGMTLDEIYWMRQRLAALQDAGKIDVEEEFRQACFHITVYKSYIGAGPAHHKHHQINPDDDDDAGSTETAGATAVGR